MQQPGHDHQLVLVTVARVVAALPVMVVVADVAALPATNALRCACVWKTLSSGDCLMMSPMMGMICHPCVVEDFRQTQFVTGLFAYHSL